MLNKVYGLLHTTGLNPGPFGGSRVPEWAIQWALIPEGCFQVFILNTILACQCPCEFESKTHRSRPMLRGVLVWSVKPRGSSYCDLDLHQQSLGGRKWNYTRSTTSWKQNIEHIFFMQGSWTFWNSWQVNGNSWILD